MLTLLPLCMRIYLIIMQMVTSFSRACIVFSNYPKAGNSFLNNYLHTLIHSLKKQKYRKFLKNLHTEDLGHIST